MIMELDHQMIQYCHMLHNTGMSTASLMEKGLSMLFKQGAMNDVTTHDKRLIDCGIKNENISANITRK
jgi:hypothetical protein